MKQESIDAARAIAKEAGRQAGRRGTAAKEKQGVLSLFVVPDEAEASLAAAFDEGVKEGKMMRLAIALRVVKAARAARAAVQFLVRLPREVAQFGLSAVLKAAPAAAGCKEYIDWVNNRE
jgi:hypothetical protein